MKLKINHIFTTYSLWNSYTHNVMLSIILRHKLIYVTFYSSIKKQATSRTGNSTKLVRFLENNCCFFQCAKLLLTNEEMISVKTLSTYWHLRCERCQVHYGVISVTIENYHLTSQCDNRMPLAFTAHVSIKLSFVNNVYIKNNYV